MFSAEGEPKWSLKDEDEEEGEEGCHKEIRSLIFLEKSKIWSPEYVHCTWH